MKRLGALLLVTAMSCGGNKGPVEPVVPEQGWYTQEGWSGECYVPIPLEGLGNSAKRMARQEILKAMMTQWDGSRDDAFDAGDSAVSVETVLLGEPDRIGALGVENLRQCQQARAKGSVGEWQGWVEGLPAVLTAGACTSPPMRYNLFDYLDIGNGWQVPVGVCEDDEIRIEASSNDYYRITDNGPWINADGDRSQETVGTDHPCNIEGCFAGMLVMRFKADSGVETIAPIGTDGTFRAPSHGTVWVSINDTTWFDNTFKVEGSIEHHTSIEYSPVE